MKTSSKIYLADSQIKSAGRGVFASRKIKKDETIEVCPVILLEGEGEKLRRSELYHYYFIWDKQPDAAIALGFGSLYNHSYSPNATYKKHVSAKTLEIIAVRDIEKNEEITINYKYGDPNMSLRFD
jgi:SET domain-containing protein